MTSQSALRASGIAGAVCFQRRRHLADAVGDREARQIDGVGPGQAQQRGQSTGKAVQREVRRALPSPRRYRPARTLCVRDGVHRPRAAGRGRSTKRNAGQRAASLAIAACGVAPSVKNP